MTRHRRRWAAIVATAIAVSSWSTGPAGAVTAPFEQAVSYYSAVPDRLGMGTASADASANVSGAVSVQASATSQAPAGFVYEGYLYSYTGGSRASAYAIVQQNFYDVASGPRDLTVNFNITGFSASSSPSGTLLYGASQSSGYITPAVGVYAYVYQCGISQTCPAASFHYDFRQLYFPRTLTSQIRLSVPAGSKVFVQAYLYLVAQAVGSGASASGSISGSVTSIDIS